MFINDNTRDAVSRALRPGHATQHNTQQARAAIVAQLTTVDPETLTAKAVALAFLAGVDVAIGIPPKHFPAAIAKALASELND